MKTSANTLLGHCLTVFLLWGCGWKRRRASSSENAGSEWQDPLTGLWYGERNAMVLLKAYALAEYGQAKLNTRRYRTLFLIPHYLLLSYKLLAKAALFFPDGASLEPVTSPRGAARNKQPTEKGSYRCSTLRRRAELGLSRRIRMIQTALQK